MQLIKLVLLREIKVLNCILYFRNNWEEKEQTKPEREHNENTTAHAQWLQNSDI